MAGTSSAPSFPRSGLSWGGERRVFAACVGCTGHSRPRRTRRAGARCRQGRAGAGAAFGVHGLTCFGGSHLVPPFGPTQPYLRTLFPFVLCSLVRCAAGTSMEVSTPCSAPSMSSASLGSRGRGGSATARHRCRAAAASFWANAVPIPAKPRSDLREAETTRRWLRPACAIALRGKWTRPRWAAAPGTRFAAAFDPSCASSPNPSGFAAEVTSLTPRRPRRVSERRNSAQNGSASDWPVAMPNTRACRPNPTQVRRGGRPPAHLRSRLGRLPRQAGPHRCYTTSKDLTA